MRKRFGLLLLLASDALTGVQAGVDRARVVDADAEPGSWLTHGRNYAEDRESPLAIITRDNVARLGLAWYYDTGTKRGLEASPLVIDGVMYTTTSWSRVIAIDAKTGELLWQFDPQVPREWGTHACCDVVNRGVAAWGNSVYVGTIDGRLIALDNATGDIRWSVSTIDNSRPYTITGAPRAINGKIVIGNGGAEYGVRGYVSAYDAGTGDMVWRFYTVPGDPALPPESPAMEMAAETWTGDVYWQVGGGGTVWDSMAFDPELDLLYIGVGNGSPWNRWVRSPGGGDNLFLSSIVALDANTGAYRWHYQTTPADTWDYTATQHIILADLEIDNRLRKVLMQAPKNGFFYVIDRTNGELISAENYVPVTWASHVDPESGRPVETDNADHSTESQTTSPAAIGGHNWQPMAFNGAEGLVFIPAMEMIQPYSTAANFAYNPLGWNLGQAEPDSEGGGASGIPAPMIKAVMKHLMRGKLIAWDPIAQRERWQVSHQNIWNGGLLTTRTGLVFQGTGDNRLVAYDASDGRVLWQAATGTGIVAPPISYEIGGEQFVAVMAGWGGVGGLALPQQINANGTSRVLVYKLDGDASHPVETQRPRLAVPPPPVTGADTSIDRGEALFVEHCARCHGANVGIGSGVVKDLRYMSTGTHEIFDEIVRDGLYSGLGMIGFADQLSSDDTTDIHHYLIKVANDTWQQQNASGWWHDFSGWVTSGIGDVIGRVMAPSE
jgi:quinohemoprotein ethanol dehydrogenase